MWKRGYGKRIDLIPTVISFPMLFIRGKLKQYIATNEEVPKRKKSRLQMLHKLTGYFQLNLLYLLYNNNNKYV